MTIRGWWRQLTKTNAELDAESIKAEALRAGANTVEEIRSGESVRVRGVIKSVSLIPEGATPVFEADIFDGSGTLVVRWMGRRSIRGVTPGKSIELEGRVTEIGGRRTVCNPEYWLHG